MTTTELLATIRAFVEEQIKKYHDPDDYFIPSHPILGFLDTLSVDVPEGLDEAAIDFADNARKQLFTKDYAISSIADYDHGCIDGFKAGAEWAFGQMKEDRK